jgi:hypothetical protein
MPSYASGYCSRPSFLAQPSSRELIAQSTLPTWCLVRGEPRIDYPQCPYVRAHDMGRWRRWKKKPQRLAGIMACVIPSREAVHEHDPVDGSRRAWLNLSAPSKGFACHARHRHQRWQKSGKDSNALPDVVEVAGRTGSLWLSRSDEGEMIS